MKKNHDNDYSLNYNLHLKNKKFIDQFKTTNINILLNRVKIEKKNDFKKKLYFFSMLSLVIIIFSSIAISI
jgi:hypothetical protein